MSCERRFVIVETAVAVPDHIACTKQKWDYLHRKMAESDIEVCPRHLLEGRVLRPQ